MNPNADRRRVRINRAKWDQDNCQDCGRPIALWFAVKKCTPCMEQVADAFDDCRRNKPSLVRYYR